MIMLVVIWKSKFANNSIRGFNNPKPGHKINSCMLHLYIHHYGCSLRWFCVCALNSDMGIKNRRDLPECIYEGVLQHQVVISPLCRDLIPAGRHHLHLQLAQLPLLCCVIHDLSTIAINISIHQNDFNITVFCSCCLTKLPNA